MGPSEFDESEFFRAIAESGARALLIGRRALVALGLPLLTADYDFWIHIDDAAKFNHAGRTVGLVPSQTPEEARKSGRYVLENDEHVDVLLARSVPTVDGARVAFDEIWPRRETLDRGDGVTICVPALDDLVATKKFAARRKDVADIQLIEGLKSQRSRR